MAQVRRPSSGGNRRKARRRQPVAETAREERAYDPTPWWDFPASSRVRRARYDSANQILEVEWMKPGVPYLYFNVPPNIWGNMRRVKSVGKFVSRVLNQYSYAPKVD